MPGPIILDTNLLVLLIIGLTSEEYIVKHKNTNTYSVEEFRLLKSVLSNYDLIVVTPHVLAETSNLCRQFADPGKSLISLQLKLLLREVNELFIDSRVATDRNEYIPLGLTDAGIIEAQRLDIPLLTDDLDLFIASQSAGRRAYNFSHLREDYI
jgi:hypothetical protein